MVGGGIESMDIEYSPLKLSLNKEEDSNVLMDLNDNSLTKGLDQITHKNLKKSKLN